jgi:hypothetical protein
VYEKTKIAGDDEDEVYENDETNEGEAIDGQRSLLKS